VKRGPRVVVLVKRTSYRKLILHENDPQIKSLIQKGDPTVRKMRRSHEDHEETVREVRAALDHLGARAKFLDGPRSPIEGTFDLVMTVGGDGTLLGTSHQIGPDVPLLGVNSAPKHSVGFFCGAEKGTVLETVRAALDGSLDRSLLSRMRVDLNDTCIHGRVLNEMLFCHASPAATSRYILRVQDAEGRVEEEEQRSSGLWIGPAAGSTAAQRSAGGRVLPLTSTKLQFVVREPYTPINVPLQLPMGLCDEKGAIEIRNKMRESKIFLDGHHTVIDTTIGDVIRCYRSGETLTVLGLSDASDHGARKNP
jgi:NAD+ kinase